MFFVVVGLVAGYTIAWAGEPTRQVLGWSVAITALPIGVCPDQRKCGRAVIEVGVDVPNANMMIIFNAERFGLAQIHQLRGRTGRGEHKSFCILMCDPEKSEARLRMKILEETRDGFLIAEEDLRQRGPGEVLGTQQSGLPDFKFGNLIDDWRLIQKARDLVAREPRD